MENAGTTTKTYVSTGAGIAIAGAWLAGAAITITIILIMTVFSTASAADVAKISVFGPIFVLLLIASPMIAAYNITKRILSGGK